MDVLIVDSAARGHAEAWKVAQSPDCDRLWLTQAGALAQEIAEVPVYSSGDPIPADDTDGLRVFAKQNGIDLAIVSADKPLEAGVVDELETEGILAFGPNRAAAQIEWSKIFAKRLMRELHIPTAPFEVFSGYKAAMDYAWDHGFPLYGKRDGLLQGKGAKECQSLHDVHHALKPILDSGHSLQEEYLLEDYLAGPEISLHIWADGKGKDEDYEMFPFAMQDNKTIYEDGQGPMTGGMGVVGPVPHLSPIDIEKFGTRLVAPVLDWLAKDGRPFKGILYPGLKLTFFGPNVVEYNARGGDPEMQVALSLLESDFLSVAHACARGELGTIRPIRWKRAAAVCLTLAAEGYPDPDNVCKGAVIEGVNEAREQPGIQIFDYGTVERGGELVVNTGRVLSVVSISQNGETMEQALQRGFQAADMIRFGGKPPQIRRDIGRSALSPAFRQRAMQTRNLL